MSQRGSARAALIALAAAVALTVAPYVVERFALPAAGGNILVSADVRTDGTMGVVESLLRGPYPDEGAWMSAPTTVQVAAGTGSIEFDFGESTQLAALLLQAPARDRYEVEASSDAGATWRSIWTVENVDAGRKRGFRNRQTRFDPPLELTRLRLRNDAAYGTLSAISALRAYSTVPEGWPALAPLQSPSLRSRYPWTRDADVVYVAKFIVALVATPLLLACSPAIRRRLPKRTRPWLKRAAITASVVAGLGWWNLLQLTTEGTGLIFEGPWDAYHYYMAAKFAPELGQSRLYECYLAADLEDGLGTHQLRRAEIRDLSTHELVPTARAFDEWPAKCKAHFSPERWEEWKHDNAFFRTRMPAMTYWVLLPTDYGFNGSPAWVIAGRGLASLVPLTDLSFWLLISADTVCFVLMWTLAWTAFGWRAACLGIVFWGTNLLAGNYFMLGAYLRQDWLLMTIAGICFVKQQRMALAGAALAYATTLRLFPALVVLGLLSKIGCDMVRARSFRLSRPHRRLIASGIAATLVIGGLSVAATGRTTAWQEFSHNLLGFQDTQKPQQVGLGSLLASAEYYLKKSSPRPSPDPSGEHTGVLRSWPSQLIRVVLPLLLLPLFIAAIWKEEDWVAAVLGVGLIAFAGDVNNYYCEILLAFAFLAVRSELAAVSFGVLTVLLAGLCLEFKLFQIGGDRGLYAVGSAIVVAHSLWIVGLFALRARGRPVRSGVESR